MNVPPVAFFRVTPSTVTSVSNGSAPCSEIPEASSCTPGIVPRIPAALVPLKLARVFTGRLLASSEVKVPLIVGLSVSIAEAVSALTVTSC